MVCFRPLSYDKTLLGFSITKGRSIIECLLTFRYWFRCWGSKPRIVITDGGTWYTILDHLGILWGVLRGGIRSYFISNVSSPLSRVIVVYTLFSVVPVLSRQSMVLTIFQFFSFYSLYVLL